MNLRRKLKQFAVYWPPATLNDLGQEVLGPPVEVKCRWEAETVEKVTKTGQEWMSTAHVYLTHQVEEGGWLWEGKLNRVPDRFDPRTGKNAARIEMLESVPNRRATQILRCAYL